jgi:Ribbon-helix-helix protein, copG family
MRIKRPETLHVRVTEQEQIILERLAARTGQSISELVRTMARRELAAVDPSFTGVSFRSEAPSVKFR